MQVSPVVGSVTCREIRSELEGDICNRHNTEDCDQRSIPNVLVDNQCTGGAGTRNEWHVFVEFSSWHKHLRASVVDMTPTAESKPLSGTTTAISYIIGIEEIRTHKQSDLTIMTVGTL